MVDIFGKSVSEILLDTQIFYMKINNSYRKRDVIYIYYNGRTDPSQRKASNQKSFYGKLVQNKLSGIDEK